MIYGKPATCNWRTFLEDLMRRGLKGEKLVISDDHSGLTAALRSVLPSIKWQRCLFHLGQNAGAHVPHANMRKEASQAVREIYNAIDKKEAEERMMKVVERYKDKAEKFCDWLEEHFIEDIELFGYTKED